MSTDQKPQFRMHLYTFQSRLNDGLGTERQPQYVPIAVS